jgi:Domain of unknown function (DUF4286)
LFFEFLLIMKEDKSMEKSKLSSLFSGTGGIIYNVTVKVEQQIAGDWLMWLLNDHIPSVMNTKCFVDYKVLRLLEVDDSEGPTYAAQYYAESKADYNRYIEMYSAKMRQDSFKKWGDQFVAFRSVMEVVK